MNLFMIRGLPGSGKSTLGAHIAHVLFSADDYMPKEGFDFTQLPYAHQRCLEDTVKSLVNSNVAVANTFRTRWEMQKYFDGAYEVGAGIFVMDLFDGGLDDAELAARCTHGVPVRTIKKMRDTWEHNWREGNPTPPANRVG